MALVLAYMTTTSPMLVDVEKPTPSALSLSLFLAPSRSYLSLCLLLARASTREILSYHCLSLSHPCHATSRTASKLASHSCTRARAREPSTWLPPSVAAKAEVPGSMAGNL